MGRPKLETPLKYCEYCGKQLVRRKLASGYEEALYFFNQRKYCNFTCMGKAQSAKKIINADIKPKNIKATGEQSCTDEHLCGLWGNEMYGSASRGFQSIEQLQREFSEIMQEMPCKEAQTTIVMYCLRKAAEVTAFMRQSLSESIKSGEKGIANNAEEDRAPCMQANMPPNVVWPQITGSLIARADSSPCIDRGQPFVAFAANQRDELRDLGDVAGAIQAQPGMKQQTFVAGFMAGQGAKAGSMGYGEEVSPTLKACESGLNQAPSVLAVDCRNHNIQHVSGTLQAKEGGGHSLNYINPIAVPFSFKAFGEYEESEIGKSLMACDDITTGDLVAEYYAVRRLIPVECERLQGFADNWTACGHDSKEISDSARYRALGNSVAIPCVAYVLGGIAEQEDATT